MIFHLVKAYSYFYGFTKVLRGGTQFIQTKRPLIVFEYNTISKRHYMVADIKGILGVNYVIYRLRQDGRLDGDVENAWNCAGLHKESMFQTISKPIVVGS